MSDYEQYCEYHFLNTHMDQYYEKSGDKIIHRAINRYGMEENKDGISSYLCFNLKAIFNNPFYDHYHELNDNSLLIEERNLNILLLDKEISIERKLEKFTICSDNVLEPFKKKRIRNFLKFYYLLNSDHLTTLDTISKQNIISLEKDISSFIWIHHLKPNVFENLSSEITKFSNSGPIINFLTKEDDSSILDEDCGEFIIHVDQVIEKVMFENNEIKNSYIDEKCTSDTNDIIKNTLVIFIESNFATNTIDYRSKKLLESLRASITDKELEIFEFYKYFKKKTIRTS